METGLYDMNGLTVEELFSTMSLIEYRVLYEELREGYHLAELGECPYPDLGAFFDFIRMCTHQPMRLPRNDVYVNVDRGSTIIFYRELAEIWGWSLKKVYTFIQALQEDGIILATPGEHGTVIT